MKNASVVSIFIGQKSGGVMQAVDSARAVAGHGLEGDRYWQSDRTPAAKRDVDRELTLIEEEAVSALVNDEQVPFTTAESRRNVVTRGVALNHLVGREFRVGGVRLKGIRLCEPCKHLQASTRPGVLKGLLHRGGLRAQILEGGDVKVGDPVTADE